MDCPSCNIPQPDGMRTFRVLDPATGLLQSVCVRCWSRAGTPDPVELGDAPAVGIVEVDVEVGATPTQLSPEDKTTEPLPLTPPRTSRK
jgi:hypothetical protein